MLLILTGIADGTIDFVVDYLDGDFFRFNLDDFQSYEFSMGSDSWCIRNPLGLEISSETATRCLWWKLFLYQLDNDKYIKEEVKMIAQNLYSWFLARNLVVGNPPFLESSWGKLRQANVARKYFNVPDQSAGWGAKFLDNFKKDRQWVAKSLSSQLTETGKAIFTTKVDPAKLDPSLPWYIQEEIHSDYDVTVQIVGEKLFAFARDRKKLKSLDWRREQFSNPEPWIPYPLDGLTRSAISAFCKELGISWGRMDFLLHDSGLVFLEINPNGQWVFLDPKNESGLISSVGKYLISSAS